MVDTEAQRRSCPSCGALFSAANEYCSLDGTALNTSEVDALIGRKIDRYTIVGILGDGGMARVYRAEHAFLKKPCALKVLYGDLAADERFKKRFMREGHAAGTIEHPNIVNITDFGQTKAGLPFMVMELIQGRTLSQYFAENSRPGPDWIASVVRQIADGLAAAHELGFIHRDLKPGNVMVTTGADPIAKILDFGLVRMDASMNTQLTQSGYVMGTPAYMSPEQAAGEEATTAADLYALGAILYWMLSGQTPFVGEMRDILTQHITATPRTIPNAGWLGELALELLRKDAQDRPPSAHIVRDRVDARLNSAQRSSSRPSARPSSVDQSIHSEPELSLSDLESVIGSRGASESTLAGYASATKREPFLSDRAFVGLLVIVAAAVTFGVAYFGTQDHAVDKTLRIEALPTPTALPSAASPKTPLANKGASMHRAATDKPKVPITAPSPKEPRPTTDAKKTPTTSLQENRVRAEAPSAKPPQTKSTASKASTPQEPRAQTKPRPQAPAKQAPPQKPPAKEAPPIQSPGTTVSKSTPAKQSTTEGRPAESKAPGAAAKDAPSATPSTGAAPKDSTTKKPTTKKPTTKKPTGETPPSDEFVGPLPNLDEAMDRLEATEPEVADPTEEADDADPTEEADDVDPTEEADDDNSDP